MAAQMSLASGALMNPGELKLCIVAKLRCVQHGWALLGGLSSRYGAAELRGWSTE